MEPFASNVFFAPARTEHDFFLSEFCVYPFLFAPNYRRYLSLREEFGDIDDKLAKPVNNKVHSSAAGASSHLDLQIIDLNDFLHFTKNLCLLFARSTNRIASSWTCSFGINRDRRKERNTQFSNR